MIQFVTKLIAVAALLTAGCATIATAPNLESYAAGLKAGVGTRADLERDLGPPEKEQATRSGDVALVWVQRKTETLAVGSGQSRDLMPLDGGRGYQHVIVRPVTLTVIFDSNNVIKSIQLLKP